ncbi:MAG: hypothetical protein SFY81_07320 [Verrucomicrobiota bacterium]|nr:hypothetical protein [Verrucomicrobiota bacterium]
MEQNSIKKSDQSHAQENACADQRLVMVARHAFFSSFPKTLVMATAAKSKIGTGALIARSDEPNPLDEISALVALADSLEQNVHADACIIASSPMTTEINLPRHIAEYPSQGRDHQPQKMRDY